MQLLPRVITSTAERVHREFDDRGPEACIDSLTRDLERNNPEILDMVARCATDLGNPSKILLGFGLFYRALTAECGADFENLLHPLPRVSPETRDLLVREIDQTGSETFTVACIHDLEANNPELLQLAHSFASAHGDYLGVMQAFALVYRALADEAMRERRRVH
ncbi:hypothetical protein [Methylobacterium sp. J-070]|uniref:hypothetical protein n=1 Tax=Methylobacterium sp. J-070 TaxID=2836650 RepID=UPI001FB8ED9B|nr:hypothetical protein [Methylobacterium sp. J-070]MCJ2049158.1 hypothetical protein [Methylobacterium sp. J-070]